MAKFPGTTFFNILLILILLQFSQELRLTRAAECPFYNGDCVSQYDCNNGCVTRYGHYGHCRRVNGIIESCYCYYPCHALTLDM